MSDISFPAGQASNIVVFDHAFPDELAEKLYLFAFDAMDAIGRPGPTVGGLMPDVKRTTDLDLAAMHDWTGPWSVEALREVGYDLPALDHEFAHHLGEVVNLYTEMYPLIGVKQLDDTGYKIQRYAKGDGFYVTHVDGTPTMESNRVLACVAYLNTVGKGGETNFPSHNVAVKPRAGRIVLFPATWTHPHEGTVPVSEDKFIISTFLLPTPQ